MKNQSKISIHYRKRNDGTLDDVLIVKWNYLVKPNYKVFNKYGYHKRQDGTHTTIPQKYFQGQSVEESGTP